MNRVWNFVFLFRCISMVAPFVFMGAASISFAQIQDADVQNTQSDAIENQPTQSETQKDDSEEAAGILSNPMEELALLSLTEADDDKTLDIYGFGDFNYGGTLNDKASTWHAGLHRYKSFSIGNLNLYLDAKLDKNWRFLSEIGFHFLPHGEAQMSDSGEITYGRTTSATASLNGGVDWGGIEIERAWIEYTLHDLFSIRGGLWLTPYGIWVVDHGTPVIVGIGSPYIVGEKLFPEKQSGLQIQGAYHHHGTVFGYHLTLSNGRGPFSNHLDLDKRFGYGGRLYMKTGILGELTIGTSFYTGRYTDAKKVLEPTFAKGVLTDIGVGYPIIQQYDEFSWSADLKWRWNQLLIASELVINEIAYTTKGRPPFGDYFGLTVPQPGDLAPDDRRLGMYVLAGYRLPFWNMMPYGVFEYYSFSRHEVTPKATLWHIGINEEFTPTIIGKVEYQQVTIHQTDSTHPVYAAFSDDLHYLSAQLAFAF